MKCPYCSNPNSSVVDTRTPDEKSDKNFIRRRRSCDNCSRKFTTLEKISNLDLKVIKKSHQDSFEVIKEDFLIEKIEKSVKAATGKKIENSQFNKIIQSAKKRILAKKSNEITSKEIGDIVLAEIGKVSPSAYLRFACEYLGLKSLADVKGAISKFKN